MPPLRLAIVGDIHDQWTPADQQLLLQLQPDLTLFVGDFGNESLALVQAIAAIPLRKAVILGNHDAWYTATRWRRSQCPYDWTRENRFEQQLEALGSFHVGYGRLDFPEWNLGVVGGRPCSAGGSQWQHRRFYRHYYQVGSFPESAQRIADCAIASPCDRILFLAHCGPSGLGDQPEDPCGKDWSKPGGDFGDPDLAMAIAQVQTQKAVPLVCFGHMHHRLRNRRDRQRRSWHRDTAGTIYLNAAASPRLLQTEQTTLHHLLWVELDENSLRAQQSWWTPAGVLVQSEELPLVPQPA